VTKCCIVNLDTNQIIENFNNAYTNREKLREELKTWFNKHPNA